MRDYRYLMLGFTLIVMGLVLVIVSIFDWEEIIFTVGLSFFIIGIGITLADYFNYKDKYSGFVEGKL